VKLDIYNSKRKDKADDRMTDKDITDRFENDVAKDEGDWGNTQKKYAPGPTYEEEMEDLLKSILTEAQSFSPKHTKHTENDLTACSVCGVKGHVPAKHFGKALSDENNQPVKEDFKQWADKRQDERLKKTTKRQAELEKWREGTKDLKYSLPKKKKVNESSDVEPKVVGHFIQTHLPSGKEHKGAMMDTHLRELGVNGRLSTGEKVTKDHILNHWNAQQPKNYKYRWMKEGEEEGPIKKCADCGKAHAANVPCAGKEVLLGTESEITESKKKQKKFDKTAHIKAIARNTIGQVPKGQVIIPKKDRKEKHRKNWMDESYKMFLEAADAESLHAKAARKHDEAAEHAKSGGAMIDRPYKDAFNASFATKHPTIERHIKANASHYNYDYIPHRGGRAAFHTELAKMHREADKG
jgi:hypothetical protein